MEEIDELYQAFSNVTAEESGNVISDGNNRDLQYKDTYNIHVPKTNGIIMIVTGMGLDALRYGIFIGLIAELVMKWGNYNSAIKAIIAYAVFSLIAVTNYIHWLYASEEWLAGQSAAYGQDFTDGITGYFSMSWFFPAIVIATFVAGIIGGFMGKKVLKKHFVKSGLL